jgi:hypothetical protein
MISLTRINDLEAPVHAQIGSSFDRPDMYLYKLGSMNTCTDLIGMTCINDLAAPLHAQIGSDFDQLGTYR